MKFVRAIERKLVKLLIPLWAESDVNIHVSSLLKLKEAVPKEIRFSKVYQQRLGLL